MKEHDATALGLIGFTYFIVLFLEPPDLIRIYTSKPLLAQAIFVARVKDPNSELDNTFIAIIAAIHRQHIVEFVRKALLIWLCEAVLERSIQF